MESNTSNTETAGGDRQTTGTKRSLPTIRGDTSGAGLGSPNIHELNSYFKCTVYFTASGQFSMTGQQVFQLVVEQHPLVNPNTAMVMFVDGYRIYSKDDVLYLSVANTVLPGTPFASRSQHYNIGVPGAQRPVLNYSWKNNVIDNHPIS